MQSKTYENDTISHSHEEVQQIQGSNENNGLENNQACFLLPEPLTILKYTIFVGQKVMVTFSFRCQLPREHAFRSWHSREKEVLHHNDASHTILRIAHSKHQKESASFSRRITIGEHMSFIPANEIAPWNVSI